MHFVTTLSELIAETPRKSVETIETRKPRGIVEMQWIFLASGTSKGSV